MASIVREIEAVFLYAKRQAGTDDLDEGTSTSPTEAEQYSSWAIFILISMLVIALWTSYYLRIRTIQSVHETVVSIFLGVAGGLIIRALPGHYVQDTVSFKYNYFFNMLLPPIILNCGYELNQANFFRNIGSILTFAFVGTFVSAMTLGVLISAWSHLGFENLKITFIDAVRFGALLSATDPVTILSIFSAHKVDPKLYTIIFGESVLNDAVSIVMFETAEQFSGGSSGFQNLVKGVSTFLLTFSISLIIGILIAISIALILKHSQVRQVHSIETCLIVLFAYGSYFFSNGCHMSGVVSLLFCGIALRHYAYFNMSSRTQVSVETLFHTLALLSENFIFIYLGLSLSTEVELVFRPLFITVTTIGICISRWVAVFPLSRWINWMHRIKSRNPNRPDAIPFQYQCMLFWAGLRGAVGVALATGLEGESANALRATILAVVVLTVIVFGSTTVRMLEVLGIATGVAQDTIDYSEESDLESAYYSSKHVHANTVELSDTSSQISNKSFVNLSDNSMSSHSTIESDSSPSGASYPSASLSRIPSLSRSRTLSVLARSAEDPAKWFQEFDEQVIKPVLLDLPSTFDIDVAVSTTRSNATSPSPTTASDHVSADNCSSPDSP
ncbi:Sodium/hydrogen exchanger family-domain-containing protein [Dipodascopsis uninucleata]